MSHYTVAVFTDEYTDVESLLEPYWEDLEVEKYVYLTKKEAINEGIDEIKYLKKVYKEYIKNKKYYRKKYRNNKEFLKLLKRVPGMKRWKKEQIYKFAIRCYEEKMIGENGDIYTTSNPDSKWDWYVIGGRWKDMLITKEGNKTNSAIVKNIDWEKMRENNIKDLMPYEEYIEKSYYPKEYLKELYPDEETYINAMTIFHTYAVIMPDGEWTEPGQMGWWGISSASPEQIKEFVINYKENFIKNVNQEWRLTIVDCHI